MTGKTDAQALKHISIKLDIAQMRFGYACVNLGGEYSDEDRADIRAEIEELKKQKQALQDAIGA